MYFKITSLCLAVSSAAPIRPSLAQVRARSVDSYFPSYCVESSFFTLSSIMSNSHTTRSSGTCQGEREGVVAQRIVARALHQSRFDDVISSSPRPAERSDSFHSFVVDEKVEKVHTSSCSREKRRVDIAGIDVLRLEEKCYGWRRYERNCKILLGRTSCPLRRTDSTPKWARSKASQSTC